jgi:hypothetical protein
LHSGVWATAVWDSAQIATSTAKNLISTPFVANGTGHEMLALYRARSAKVEAGFAGQTPSFVPRSRSNLFERARDLFAKPLKLWRIMRYGTAIIQSYQTVCQIRGAKCT